MCVHVMASSWTSYQIRKIAGCACAENAGNVSPRRRFQRKPLVSDSGMHHGTCVTHVSWCMSGSLTCGDGENVPGIPGACAPAILRIWQEAHGLTHKHPRWLRLMSCRIQAWYQKASTGPRHHDGYGWLGAKPTSSHQQPSYWLNCDLTTLCL